MDLKRGTTLEKMMAPASWRESDLFDGREAAALDFAEATIRSGAGVHDRCVEALFHHITEDAVVELAGVIAFQNLSSRFDAALAVPPRGFCLPVSGPGTGVPQFVESGEHHDS